MTEMIATYISRIEYQCQHCRRLPPDLKKDGDEYPFVYESLFEKFKDLRESWGKAIQITSGYRCSGHEHTISGSNISTHVFGLALDLGIPVQEQDKFVLLVECEHPEMRMGTNVHSGSVHIHLDIGYFIRPRYSDVLQEGARWIE